ncbi:MAG TPA: alpha/beta hydrolase [Burkholderiales bacterium]|nr:alpha/beta hydrolase [Burkholderiales bacterium]
MREAHIASLGPHGFHRVRYYEWGEADNPRVLICAHGLTRNGRDFDDLARALCSDFRVLCPDVVGRGRSDWLAHKEDYGYPLYCSDMAALIARSGAETVCWVGTSMGGLIGMLLAAQPNSPIRALVMNDIGPFIPKPSLVRLSEYVGKDPAFDSFDALEQYIRMVSAPFGPLTDAQWRHLTTTSATRHEDGKWRLIYDPAIGIAFQGQVDDVVLWPLWDRVRCPTLVLRGAESDLLLKDTAVEMTRRGPNAKLVEFAGIGHAPMLMAEDQIDVVREFLLANDS